MTGIALLDLPDLVLEKVLMALKCPREVANCQRTCKRLYNVSKSNAVWEVLLHFFYGVNIRAQSSKVSLLKETNTALACPQDNLFVFVTDVLATLIFCIGVQVSELCYRCRFGLAHLQTPCSCVCILKYRTNFLIHSRLPARLSWQCGCGVDRLVSPIALLACPCSAWLMNSWQTKVVLILREQVCTHYSVSFSFQQALRGPYGARIAKSCMKSSETWQLRNQRCCAFLAFSLMVACRRIGQCTGDIRFLLLLLLSSFCTARPVILFIASTAQYLMEIICFCRVWSCTKLMQVKTCQVSSQEHESRRSY